MEQVSIVSSPMEQFRRAIQQLGKPALHKGLFYYGAHKSVSLKQKFDRPVLRSVSLVFFSLMVSGLIVAVVYGVNMKRHCSWCKCVDCISWICDIKVPSYKKVESGGHTAFTCLGNDNYKILPSANIPAA